MVKTIARTILFLTVTVIAVFTLSAAKKTKTVLPDETQIKTEVKKETEKKKTQETKKEEKKIDEETIDDKSASVTPEVTFANPLSSGFISKEFSIEMPIFSNTMNDYRVHKGIDIEAEKGAPVMAISDGNVECIYDDAMMGHCISVNHGNGLVSYYMGLSDEICDGITEGAPVYCGQVLSSVGDSTLVEIGENDHLHLEILKKSHIFQ